MSSLELGYCSREQFEAGKPNRVMPLELIADEKYILMLALKRATGSKVAAKKLCAIAAVSETDPGLCLVEFDFLNQDMGVEYSGVDGVFDDGYWNGHSVTRNKKILIGDIAVTKGYFQNYIDPLDLEFRTLLEANSLGQVRQLSTV